MERVRDRETEGGRDRPRNSYRETKSVFLSWRDKHPLVIITKPRVERLYMTTSVERQRALINPGLWEGYHERRRCSRDTYPESCITKYTSVRRLFSRDRHHDPCRGTTGVCLFWRKTTHDSQGHLDHRKQHPPLGPP